MNITRHLNPSQTQRSGIDTLCVKTFQAIPLLVTWYSPFKTGPLGEQWANNLGVPATLPRRVKVTSLGTHIFGFSISIENLAGKLPAKLSDRPIENPTSRFVRRPRGEIHEALIGAKLSLHVT